METPTPVQSPVADHLRVVSLTIISTMNGLVHILLISLSLHHVYATWRQDHAVTGLPTLNGPDLTSFAGVVPVRKDTDRIIEVDPP